MKPTIGRIVFYVMSELDSAGVAGIVIRPAMVVNTRATDLVEGGSKVNLQVFHDGENDGLCGTLWVAGIPYSREPKPRTWHWPPRI